MAAQKNIQSAIIVVFSLVATGCNTINGSLMPDTYSVSGIRSIQTRTFEEISFDNMVFSVIDSFQDAGLIIGSTSKDLGIISAYSRGNNSFGVNASVRNGQEGAVSVRFSISHDYYTPSSIAFDPYGYMYTNTTSPQNTNLAEVYQRLFEALDHAVFLRMNTTE